MCECVFSGRQSNSDCDGPLRSLNSITLAIQPTEYESYGKSSLHSFSCRVLLAVSVDDAAPLHSQLWRFRRAVALPDQADGYPQGMRRWSGGGQILHLIEDERDGVRHADLIRATSSCRPRN
jgi:hypothetical protein